MCEQWFRWRAGVRCLSLVILMLGVSGLELSSAVLAQDQPATLPEKNVREEVAIALQRQRERISTIRLRWTVAQADTADAPLDAKPEEAITTAIELRWANDGRRYFYHTVQMRNDAVEFRRAECADGARIWKAEYPRGESSLEHPTQMTWGSQADPRKTTFRAVPLEAMGFPAIGDSSMAVRSVLPSLGDVEIEGELCHRFGMPERLEEIRSPHYGWQAISSFSLSGPMTGMRNWRTEQSWSEFSEIEPGLWLPRRGRINRLAELNPSFEIWSVESVDLNPRLSDADFRIPVVEGTPISQARDPSGKLPDGAPLPVPVAVEDDTDQWKWNLGLAVACLLAIVGLLGWRRRA